MSTVDNTARTVDAKIGKILSFRRQHLGLSQNELADICGISRGTLLHHELGFASIPAGRLVRVASALGLRASWILQQAENEHRAPDAKTAQAA